MKFTRGYKKFREKAGGKYVVSCLNCRYFYQAVGDSEDLCQNPDVLEYDMINTESSIYCLQWKPVEDSKNDDKNTFRSGVSLVGHKKKVSKARKNSGKKPKR